MKIFVTGGAGYVGAHCCKALAAKGWQVTVFDNLSRGWKSAVKWGPLIVGDILDPVGLQEAIQRCQPDAVAHFAALAYVGESVSDPAVYYRTNVVGSLNLLDAMRGAGVANLIFSSTCASYGIPDRLPIDETHPQRPINPYGWSKLAAERAIEAYTAAYGINAVALRYFNAAGCDPDGEIGEHHEPETHAIPLAIAAALGADQFSVLGTDFATPDGSAIRDYVHVTDLAAAHVKAIEFLSTARGFHAFNLGTEVGTSVMKMLDAVAGVAGVDVPHTKMGRRQGDPAELVASATKAREVLGWTPDHSSIDHIVETAFMWQRGRQRS